MEKTGIRAEHEGATYSVRGRQCWGSPSEHGQICLLLPFGQQPWKTCVRHLVGLQYTSNARSCELLCKHHEDSPFPQCPCKNCHLGAPTHRESGTAASSPSLTCFSPTDMKLDQTAGLMWLARGTPLSNRKGVPSRGQLATE